MKNLTESILNGGAHSSLNTLDEIADIEKINSSRNPRGGKVTTDTWGHPIKIGDYVIGTTSTYPDSVDVGNWQSSGNLIVGKIVEVYNGGVNVLILDESHLKNAPDWAVKNADKFGGVTTTIKPKAGFVKIDPKLLTQIFPV